ncbi:MAG: FAD-binding oxidoreductase [Actinomycetota bacterium]|jgi:FAD/FMN-containing dehydrogenase|nr:FAD-binding oxidoreductase [Actinomycetota bacterium]
MSRRRTASARTPPAAAIDPAAVRRLVDVVGRRHVLTDPELTATSCVDWTGRYAGRTPAVVRPGDVTEVAAAVACCAELGVAIVPQGGNTGLVGGSVPLHGEVVLSTSRLVAIDGVDAAGGQLTAAAGVTIETVHMAASEVGWAYGVDLASRGSATVGGSVATNAGGLRVLRYGDTRAQVVGIEAVLGTGAIVSHLGGLLKDNTGYALPALLCGSEGTLGVVTAVRLRLVPAADRRVTALAAFDSVRSAVDAANGLRRTLSSLDAVELIVGRSLELVCALRGRPLPFDVTNPAYLLVEAAARVDPGDDLAGALGAAGGVVDVAVAEGSSRRGDLWAYREELPSAVNSLGAPHKLDVALPQAALAAFVDEVPRIVSDVAPEAETWLWGHVGDGNVHVNITGVAPDDDRPDDAVLRVVADLGGSISAEHGIGTAKRRWLHLNRSAEEMAAFASIKRALDPAGILNPHVLLPEL